MGRWSISAAVVGAWLLLASCADSDPDAAVCGNGIVEPPEQCDDGNRNFLDGCSPECVLDREINFDAVVNVCPKINACILAPSAGPVGSRLMMDIDVEDPDDEMLGLSWDVTGGDIQVLTASTAAYLCTESGRHDLQIAISDPHCTTTFELSAVCY